MSALTHTYKQITERFYWLESSSILITNLYFSIVFHFSILSRDANFRISFILFRSQKLSFSIHDRERNHRKHENRKKINFHTIVTTNNSLSLIFIYLYYGLTVLQYLRMCSISLVKQTNKYTSKHKQSLVV